MNNYILPPVAGTPSWSREAPVPQKFTIDYYQATSAVKQIGQLVVTTSPIVAAAKSLRPNLASIRGVGAEGEDDQWKRLGYVATGVIVVLVGLAGALSYQAGKAMAPNKASEKTWGWIGVPVGMFTGPWGLGLMGIVSNSRK